MSWAMRFCRGFLLIILIAWYILALLWHLSISNARLSSLPFLSSFNILVISWSILFRWVFNSVTFSLLTVELKRRRSSFSRSDTRSSTELCIWWFLLFLMRPIVFFAAPVILARIFSHAVHYSLQRFLCNCFW